MEVSLEMDIRCYSEPPAVGLRMAQFASCLLGIEVSTHQYRDLSLH